MALTIAGQRFALLKIAPGNFFITRDGWYGESGLSTRQAVGVTPDERHELCEWPGKRRRGTRVIRATSSVNPRINPPLLAILHW